MSELYQPSNRSLSVRLMPTFVDKGCYVVSATDTHGCILGLLDRSRYYFFQVAPQAYSQGWVDPVPDPLLLRKSGSAGNGTRDPWICSQELWPLGTTGEVSEAHYLKKKISIQKNWCQIHRNPQIMRNMKKKEDTLYSKIGPKDHIRYCFTLYSTLYRGAGILLILIR
jgi:hypothetical protein